MELKEAIKARRSIRKYAEKRVLTHEIIEILDIARLAPSAGNTQNWRFIIVTDIEKKKKIAESSLKQHWMTTAPAYIVICNKHKRLQDLYGKHGRMFATQNCAIIATYIMLLAAERGLGTCWVGCFDQHELQQLLSIPEDISPEIVLTIGYSEEKKVTEHQRDELEHFVYFDKWENKIAKEEKPSIKERLKGLVKIQ